MDVKICKADDEKVVTNRLLARGQRGLLAHFPKTCLGADRSAATRLFRGKDGFQVFELSFHFVSLRVHTGHG